MTRPNLDATQALALVEARWRDEIVPALREYLLIPNRSPAFDKDWVAAGHMDRAVALVEKWCRARALPGLTVEVVRLEGRTPVLLLELPGRGARASDTVLLYGHLDKQPEMTGWREGLSPWKPVLEGERLYGRGGADDGYAVFASLTALEVLHAQGLDHARAVVLIETCEESGSYDLPHYIEALAPRIGTPSLVVCLDSGCGNYEQLWSTTSLRGLVGGTLRVEMLREGVHSGDASGVVASTFRVARMLLSRIEDEATGRVLLPELHTEIPAERVAQAHEAARVLGADVVAKFPFVPGAGPTSDDLTELLLRRTWRPAVSVIGAAGLPELERAGNVLRPFTALQLSVRIPAHVDPEVASKALKTALEASPPYGAKVSFSADKASVGWDAPPTAPWLAKAVDEASRTYFGKPAAALGEGGTIPFMGMLGARFPEAQFVITGVLGPGSNAHGPNEFLDLPTARRLTACVASLLAAHAAR